MSDLNDFEKLELSFFRGVKGFENGRYERPIEDDGEDCTLEELVRTCDDRDIKNLIVSNIRAIMPKTEYEYICRVVKEFEYTVKSEIQNTMYVGFLGYCWFKRLAMHVNDFVVKYHCCYVGSDELTYIISRTGVKIIEDSVNMVESHLITYHWDGDDLRSVGGRVPYDIRGVNDLHCDPVWFNNVMDSMFQTARFLYRMRQRWRIHNRPRRKVWNRRKIKYLQLACEGSLLYTSMVPIR